MHLAQSCKVLKCPLKLPLTQAQSDPPRVAPNNTALGDPYHVPFGRLTADCQQHDGQNTRRISCRYCSCSRIPEKEGSRTPSSWPKAVATAWQCLSAEREVHVEAGFRLAQRLWYVRPRFSACVS